MNDLENKIIELQAEIVMLQNTINNLTNSLSYNKTLYDDLLKRYYELKNKYEG